MYVNIQDKDNSLKMKTTNMFSKKNIGDRGQSQQNILRTSLWLLRI